MPKETVVVSSWMRVSMRFFRITDAVNVWRVAGGRKSLAVSHLFLTVRSCEARSDGQCSPRLSAHPRGMAGPHLGPCWSRLAYSRLPPGRGRFHRGISPPFFHVISEAHLRSIAHHSIILGLRINGPGFFRLVLLPRHLLDISSPFDLARGLIRWSSSSVFVLHGGKLVVAAF